MLPESLDESIRACVYVLRWLPLQPLHFGYWAFLHGMRPHGSLFLKISGSLLLFFFWSSLAAVGMRRGGLVHCGLPSFLTGKTCLGKMEWDLIYRRVFIGETNLIFHDEMANGVVKYNLERWGEMLPTTWKNAYAFGTILGRC